jgi:Protein of unknown function (DUF3034)
MQISTKIHSVKFRLVQYAIILCCLIGSSSLTQAYDVGSRILATGGASQVEGSAGGGIVPWAVLSGYGQTGEWGGDAFGTYIKTDDFDVSAAGISLSYNNRVEVSIATQILGIDAIQGSLNLPDDELKQTIIGAKVRLFGDLIYGDLPQVSLGIQYKKNMDFDVPAIAGAIDDDGVDYYVSASRLWLSGIYGYPLLFNATLRSTKANQLGLLGFGGDINNSHEFLFEGSVGLLLRRDLLLGFEYREKPNNLSFAREDDWKDLFIAYFPNKHLSVVGAWADLGDVAGKKNQDGFYLSVEGSF